MTDNPNYINYYEFIFEDVLHLNIEKITNKYLTILTEKKIKIIKLRFGLGCRKHTYKEIGEQFYVTPARIRQIINHTIKKLNYQLTVNLRSSFTGELLIQPKSEELILDKEKIDEMNQLYLLPIEDLELTTRLINCLKSEHIFFLGDLVQCEEYRLLKTPNLGRKSLNEIKSLLMKFGLSLGTKVKNWPPAKLLPEIERLRKEQAEIEWNKLNIPQAETEEQLAKLKSELQLEFIKLMQ